MVRTPLDPAVQPFLADHRIDGVPVLPGVMGIEAFAEVAGLLVPDRHVSAIEDVDFREPVKFYRDEPRTVTVSAVVTPDTDGAGGARDDLLAHCRLTATRDLPGQETPRETVHFTGRVRLAARAPEPVPAAPPQEAATADGAESVVTRDAIYAIYFHGPAYQVVERAWRHGNGIAGRLRAALPPDLRSAAGPLVARPRLVELCFQAAGVEELGSTGRLALPLHVDRVVLPTVEREEEPAAAEATVQATVAVEPGADGFTAQVVDQAGQVLVRLDGYRTVELPDAIDQRLLDPLQTALAAR